MTDSQEEKQGYSLKDYAEMASGLGTGYGLVKGLVGRPAPYVPPNNFVGSISLSRFESCKWCYS